MIDSLLHASLYKDVELCIHGGDNSLNSKSAFFIKLCKLIKLLAIYPTCLTVSYYCSICSVRILYKIWMFSFLYSL